MAPGANQPVVPASRGEQVIAALGAAACLLITARIWTVVAVTQNTWLFPALYFIELIALSLACAIAYGLSSPSRPIVAWVTVGVLAAFAMLGAWSVGLYYLPVAALFLTLAVGGDLRHKRSVGLHAAAGLLAALFQSIATLLLARAL